MVDMMWYPNYKKVDKTNRIDSKHTIYSPIVIDNTLHIVKGVVKNIEKDVNDSYESELMYKCNLVLNVKSKFFNFLYLTKKIEIKNANIYCLSHYFLDCLLRTLSTYKKSNDFILSNELQKIIIENDLMNELFEKGITSNRFPSNLTFNKKDKKIDKNKKYNKIVNSVSLN